MTSTAKVTRVCIEEIDRLIGKREAELDHEVALQHVTALLLGQQILDLRMYLEMMRGKLEGFQIAINTITRDETRKMIKAASNISDGIFAVEIASKEVANATVKGAQPSENTSANRPAGC